MSFDKVVDALRAQRNLPSLGTKRIRVGGGGEQGMNEGWKRTRYKQVGKERILRIREVNQVLYSWREKDGKPRSDRRYMRNTPEGGVGLPRPQLVPPSVALPAPSKPKPVTSTRLPPIGYANERSLSGPISRGHGLGTSSGPPLPHRPAFD